MFNLSACTLSFSLNDASTITYSSTFIPLMFSFFSSRRRHTRWPRDWSSDVCSSDLWTATGPGVTLCHGVTPGPVAVHRHDFGFEHRGAAGHGGSERGPRRGCVRDRQPGQRNSRHRDPVPQSGFRMGRNHRVDNDWSGAVSVTSPKGFRAAGVAAGLKTSGAKDVALVVNDGLDQIAAAVFTTNRIQAAPVVWSQSQVTKTGTARGVVLNSRGANAATGAAGLADTEQTAQRAAQLLETTPEQVLVCSTGLIGVRLPMPALLSGLETAHSELSDSATAGANAAAAIMTTDTVSKTVGVERAGWSVGGIAKGAGMLAPGMATMLVVLTTDAVTDSATLDAALRAATSVTFDRVDSDGCMSTNDTVIALASGASAVTPSPDELAQALHEASANLARQLVADAEGATHDIAITVQNAITEMAALIVARAISRSNLFKTAVFGNDPNWGRIISAAGTIPAEIAPFDPHEIDVYVNDVQVCRGGGVGEDRSLVDMTPREVQVVVDLHAGSATATVWSNDLTHDYVHENSAYSSCPTQLIRPKTRA